MRDETLLKRLPYHAPTVTPQVNRLIGERAMLGVITKGEEGINLYPGPNAARHP
jgi:hypothetical protein